MCGDGIDRDKHLTDHSVNMTKQSIKKGIKMQIKDAVVSNII